MAGHFRSIQQISWTTRSLHLQNSSNIHPPLCQPLAPGTKREQGAFFFFLTKRKLLICFFISTQYLHPSLAQPPTSTGWLRWRERPALPRKFARERNVMKRWGIAAGAKPGCSLRCQEPVTTLDTAPRTAVTGLLLPTCPSPGGQPGEGSCGSVPRGRGQEMPLWKDLGLPETAEVSVAPPLRQKTGRSWKS